MSGKVIWITGLSGAGKTTLAKNLKRRLEKFESSPILLDGDLLRTIFKTDLLGQNSFNRKTRINLALKYGLLCKTLSQQGFTVIISTIGMFNEVYFWNRANLKNYFEVYLKVPLDELYLRDEKKIYQLYKSGKLNYVAGLDVDVDEPELADVVYDFNQNPDLWESPKKLVDKLLLALENKKFILGCQDKKNRGKK